MNNQKRNGLSIYQKFIRSLTNVAYFNIFMEEGSM